MWFYLEEKLMLYNLRGGNKLVLPRAKSSLFDINSLRFRGSLLWNNLPVTAKNCQSLNEFKRAKRSGKYLLHLPSVSLKNIFMIIVQLY